MRVLYTVLIVTTMLLSAANAAPMTTSSDKTSLKKIKGDDAVDVDGQRLLRSNKSANKSMDPSDEERDGLLSIVEEVDELIEQHNHIRELFGEFCLEGKTPEEIAKGDTHNKKTVELYKKFDAYHSEHHANDQKQSRIECKLSK
ncbi:RXLR domain-containing protein [Phytophthora infestans]|uniref:RxLR effector protein n=1 Tax=Phytophthora infestans TaxID=4787 RepID=A0A833S340_PHYIN|nr:RXLR domain-containing protein [Phytophthora infestans]